MDTNRESDAQSGITKQLGLLAAAGTVTFALAFAAMHFIQPDLNPIENWGSDYAFGRGGWVMRLGFIAAGFGVVSLTLGLGKSLATGKRKRLSLVLIGLVGVGFIGSGLFNADPPLEDGTTGYTTEGSLHDLAGMILFLSLIIASFVLVGVFARDRRWHPVSRTAKTFAWLSLVGLLATITASEVTPPGSGGITGLVQRVFVTIVLAWLVLLATRVYRLGEHPGSRSSLSVGADKETSANDRGRHLDDAAAGR